MRAGISIVLGLMLALVCSSLAHADDQQYGSLEFSRMTKEQEQFFWNRLDLLAFEEAILTYCGQPDDFATRAKQGIQACVTQESLRKAETFYKAKLSVSIGRLGAQKFSCKSKAVGASLHGWLGVEVQPIAAAAGSSPKGGVLVARAMAGSPAETAGVKTGDVITSVNGADIADPKELVRRVAQNAPQATAAIGILRDGAPRTINVKLGSVAMDAQGHVAADGPSLISSSKADLNFVATETAGMCQRCKDSIWAVFCR